MTSFQFARDRIEVLKKMPGLGCMSTKGISEGNIPQGRFSAAELQYHSQLPGPIAWRRPRIPHRQRSADPSSPQKSRQYHGARIIGWSALGSRPVDSVPRQISRPEHHRTAGTLEPRGLPIAVSIAPDDRHRRASCWSPQHHDCEVIGPVSFHLRDSRLQPPENYCTDPCPISTAATAPVHHAKNTRSPIPPLCKTAAAFL